MGLRTANADVGLSQADAPRALAASAMLSTIGGSVNEKPLSLNAEQRPVAAASATPSSGAKLSKTKVAKDSPKRELVRLELLGIVQVWSALSSRPLGR